MSEPGSFVRRSLMNWPYEHIATEVQNQVEVLVPTSRVQVGRQCELPSA